MPVTLDIVGQSSMDRYYKDYRGNADFFELNDFIFGAGAVVADYYQRIYDQKYQELRQEKRAKDELVGFDPSILSVQTLTVENSLDGKSEVNLQYPVMSFFSDKSGVGYQFLLPINPKDVKLERSSMDEMWQYDYLPTTHIIFWWPQNGKLVFYKNAACNIHKVELYYIPSVMNSEGEVMGEALIPDGLVDVAINLTVAKMREVEAKVVNEVNNGNQNRPLETQMDKNQLKPQ